MTPATPGAVRFLFLAAAWSLGLFAFLRSPWIERRLLLPLTQLQGAIAAWYGGGPALPVVVSLECSGADAIALLLGAVLAYPAPWRGRLAAAGGGLLLVLAANTARIGTLALAAGSPHLFEVLHRQVWPVLLVLVSAGYALTWMLAARPAPGGDPARTARRGLAPPLRRFVTLGAALLLLWAAAAPMVTGSRLVLGAAAWMAGAAAGLLAALGVAVTVSGTVLSTGRGAFLVAQECVATPLIPVYLAAALALPRTPAARALALVAAAPLFVALGIARILLVALPPELVGSPVAAVHAFYQLLLAALAVGAVACRAGAGPGWARPAHRMLAAWALGLGLAWAGGAPYTRLIAHAVDVLGPAGGSPAPGPAPADPQGALALLPAYQSPLLVALWVAARPRVRTRWLLGGLGLLALGQVLLGLTADLVHRHGMAVHPLPVRAWAVAGPLLVFVLIARRDRGAPGGPGAAAPEPGAAARPAPA